MTDIVIVDQDALQFLPMFGNRLVIPTGPAQIRGSGQARINGRKVCISGDERMVQIHAVYTTPMHTIPGNGVIIISSLASNQRTWHTGSRPVLIVRGQQFSAQFRPTQPALMPPPANTPDGPAPSAGRGMFIPSQLLVRAS